MEYALNFGQKALATIQSELDATYLFPKMDFLAIDDFLYGAMENPGLIIYKSSRILGSEDRYNRKLIQETASIISHELVHQWFGNSKWWSWIWFEKFLLTP